MPVRGAGGERLAIMCRTENHLSHQIAFRLQLHAIVRPSEVVEVFVEDHDLAVLDHSHDASRLRRTPISSTGSPSTMIKSAIIPGELTNLPVEAERDRGVRSGAPYCLQRAQAGIGHQQLELACVPLAVRRDGEAGVGADDERHARLVRPVQRGRGLVEHAAAPVALVGRHPAQVAQSAEVGKQQQGRHERDPGFGEALDDVVGHDVAVHDPVDARRRRPRRPPPSRARESSPAVSAGGSSSAIAFSSSRRECLILAVRAVGQLDQVDAVLHLLADLGEHLVDRVRQRADAALRYAHRRRIEVGEPVARGEVTARPWSLRGPSTMPAAMPSRIPTPM